jgi:amidase
MLDCVSVPQVGDPFLIPKPQESYASLARRAPAPLRIGWSTAALMGVEVDREVARAVGDVARQLADMGHEVVEESPEFDGLQAMRHMLDVWFFGFDVRLEGYAQRSGGVIGPDTLEPITWQIYEHARTMKSAAFVAAIAGINTARRQLARFFTRHDVWLCPTTARVAEPWGTYNLGRSDVAFDDLAERIFRGPCQFTLPHNVLGAPAISLPLGMHSSGLPIGVQLAAGHANEHLVLQLASALEQAMPWAARVPPLHASTAPSPVPPAAPAAPHRP